jgi:hypothetical protein
VLAPGDRSGRLWLAMVLGVFVFLAFRRLHRSTGDAGPR